MTSASDRKLNGLYAALTPTERARLVARVLREGPSGEIDRIRDAVPDAAAGAAYNRAMRILRVLHGSTPPALHAIALGIEKGMLLLAATYDQAADRRNVLAYLARIWRLLSYPITESEYRGLVDMERADAEPVEEYLGYLCFEADPDRPGFQAELAGMAHERHGEMTEADGQALWQRFLACFRAAVKRGELPKPTRRNGALWLPRGLLSDWAEGTTAETYSPFGPSYHIPEVELFGGGSATWDIRSDAEVADVVARRAAMCDVFASIVCDGGGVDDAIVATLSMDPPPTAEERERRRNLLESVWPWGMFDGVRDDLRIIAGTLASFRAELDAYDDVIARLQTEEFGGEDPLAPVVRDLLTRAREGSRRVAELWASIIEDLAPATRGASDWPPSIDNDTLLADLLPQIEEHLRGEWDD